VRIEAARAIQSFVQSQQGLKIFSNPEELVAVMNAVRVGKEAGLLVAAINTVAIVTHRAKPRLYASECTPLVGVLVAHLDNEHANVQAEAANCLQRCVKMTISKTVLGISDTAPLVEQRATQGQ
jgi:hypothetical protein